MKNIMRKAFLLVALALVAGGAFAQTAWTAVSNTRFGDDTILAVAYGNNRFVAVGERGKIAYSTDGARWTAIPDSAIWAWPDSPDDRVSINTIAFGTAGNAGGRFVVGSGDNAKMAYSDR